MKCFCATTLVFALTLALSAASAATILTFASGSPVATAELRIRQAQGGHLTTLTFYLDSRVDDGGLLEENSPRV
jgi:hypothetical protein